MQLVAYGAQDIYLTGNPQITFFKVVYRRHTNFSMETIEQTINGTSTLSTSTGTGTVTVSRNGDLVHKVYVTVSDVAVTKGSNIVSEVELEIGGQRIDRHYEEWNNIWNELSTPESKAIGLKSMQGDIGSATTGVNMTQVPLNFWFCRNPGLALPLIALQYHEVKLKFTWGTAHGSTSTCKVFCDYIYLDTDERRRFAQVSHEYLIEQVQKQSADTSGSVKLNFNHPVKELIWTSDVTNTYTDAKLVLNGHDRFSKQEEEYFQLRQPYDYHTAVPRQNLPSTALASQGGHDRIEIMDGTDSVGEARDGSVSATGQMQTIGQISSGTVAADGTLAAAITGGDDVVGDTNATRGYLFHEADLTSQLSGLSSLVVGDTVQIVVTGTASASNHATNTTSITTTVRSKTLSAGLDNFTGTLLQFNTTLLEETFAAAAGVNLTVKSITKIAPSSIGCRTSQMTKKINVYSFGLKPEEHQPSGTCNFSRIDTAKLDTTGNLNADDNIYAVNYNVLRIMSGMGGLAYSN